VQTVLTFGNGLRMSLRVAALLADEGIGLRVVDLRWLMLLPVEDMLREANTTGRGRRRGRDPPQWRRRRGHRGGPSRARVHRTDRPVASQDSHVPFGEAANRLLLSEDDIERAVRQVLE